MVNKQEKENSEDFNIYFPRFLKFRKSTRNSVIGGWLPRHMLQPG